MSEEQAQAPSQLEIVKQELRLLKDLREILKVYTRVGPAEAAKLAGIYQWLGMMIAQSETFVRDSKKKADES